jgi:hypothetical protein
MRASQKCNPFLSIAYALGVNDHLFVTNTANSIPLFSHVSRYRNKYLMGSGLEYSIYWIFPGGNTISCNSILL